MDNPKSLNRSKRKKREEYSGKKAVNRNHHPSSGSGNGNGNGNRHQRPRDEKSVNGKSNNGGSSKPAPAVTPQQPSSTAKNDTSVSTQEKIIIANLKKETEEIANLTQKYGRRRIVSTWTRDFDIPGSVDSDNEGGADFKELIGGYSDYFVGRHFLLKEEQEWLNQSASCDSPFSLDLKCIEMGISCIPFYKRHGLSEKSFNPKEVQLMISEAGSNENLYKEMKTVAQEAPKVVLNKQNKNNDDLINKSFMDVTATLALKNDETELVSDNVSIFSNDVRKSKDRTPTDKDLISTKKDESFSKHIQSETLLNSNEENKRTFGKSTSENKISNDEIESRYRPQSRSKEDTFSVVGNQTYEREEQTMIVDNQQHEDSTNKEVKNEDSSDFVIQSLAPRSQRQRRQVHNKHDVNKVEIDKNDLKTSDDSNFLECSSFIGLIPHSKKSVTDDDDDDAFKLADPADLKSDRNKSQNVAKISSASELMVDDDNFWKVDAGNNGNCNFHELQNKDKESIESLSSSNNKNDMTLIQDEINNTCNELSSFLLNSSKSECSQNKIYNNEEVIELNLSGLKKTKGADENVKVKTNTDDDNKTVLTGINDDTKTANANLMSHESFNKDLKDSKEKDNVPLIKAINEPNELSTGNYDDDLDFLLGLSKPSNSAALSSVPKSKDCGSSIISILQEKLKGTVVNKGSSNSNFDLNTEQNNTNIKSTLAKTVTANQTDEDLDEWLDSVLES